MPEEDSNHYKKMPEEDSNPIVREEEEMTDTARIGLKLLWQALLSNPQVRKRNASFHFEEFAKMGVEALKRHNIAEAAHFLEKALRFRIFDMSGPESIRTMLKCIDAWSLEGQVICESSNKSPSVVADLMGDFNAKLKNMTQTITNEILKKNPDLSAEKEEILSILADDDNQKYKGSSDIFTEVDQLRNEMDGIELDASTVVHDPDKETTTNKVDRNIPDNLAEKQKTLSLLGDDDIQPKYKAISDSSAVPYKAISDSSAVPYKAISDYSAVPDQLRNEKNVSVIPDPDMLMQFQPAPLLEANETAGQPTKFPTED